MFWPGCEQTAEFPGEGLFGGSQSWCHVPASAQSLLTCSADILKKHIQQYMYSIVELILVSVLGVRLELKEFLFLKWIGII